MAKKSNAKRDAFISKKIAKMTLEEKGLLKPPIIIALIYMDASST